MSFDLIGLAPSIDALVRRMGSSPHVQLATIVDANYSNPEICLMHLCPSAAMKRGQRLVEVASEGLRDRRRKQL